MCLFVGLECDSTGARSLGVQHDNAISEKYVPRLPKPLVYHSINSYRTLLYTMTSYGTSFCGTMSSCITYRILTYEMTFHRMASCEIIFYRLRLRT